MSTKEQILNVTEELVLSKGFNAFSFADIADRLGIKKASVHYHFASKEQLGQSLVKYHLINIRQGLAASKKETPEERLHGFLSLYATRKQNNQVCLVGTLSTDLMTLGESMQQELSTLASLILDGLTDILIEGKNENTFRFAEQPRTMALIIITNLMGALQVSRLTGDADFEHIKRSILDNLLINQ